MLIFWLIGYKHISYDKTLTYDDFFKNIPHLKPNRKLVRGKTYWKDIKNSTDSWRVYPSLWWFSSLCFKRSLPNDFR